jgi:hypothetical protein
MGKSTFQLIPFDRDLFSNRYQIEGNIRRSRSRLNIFYRVTGPLEGLCIEPMADEPVRKDRLWEKTCFECFIGTARSARYWEINMSPAGHWNVYRFDDYRRGMQEDALFDRMNVSINSTDGRFELSGGLDLTPIGLKQQPILIALSAILTRIIGEPTYWALTHPGPKPDFHQREGFALTLQKGE